MEALWAASTLLTSFVGGLVSLLCLRVLLGIGESVAFLGERAVRLSDAVLTQIESPIHQTVALMTGVRTGTRTLWSRLAGRIAGRMGHATSNGGYRHE